MPVALTFWLGVAFAALAIVNAALAAWLWSFPIKPAGTDQDGASTAPPMWTKVHRTLGCVLIAIYAALLWEMLPRLWRFEAGWDARVILHSVLGAAFVPIVIAKVLVIRRFTRHGRLLPWLGGSLCGAALISLALVARPAKRVLSPVDPGSATNATLLEAGRRAVLSSCLQCHGAGPILAGRRDRHDWGEVVEKMRERSRTSSDRRHVADAECDAIVEFLDTIAGLDSPRPSEPRHRPGETPSRR